MGDPTLYEYRIHQLEERVAELRQVNRARSRAERRQVAAGLSFLGSLVLVLLGVIWSYRSVIVR